MRAFPCHAALLRRAPPRAQTRVKPALRVQQTQQTQPQPQQARSPFLRITPSLPKPPVQPATDSAEPLALARRAVCVCLEVASELLPLLRELRAFAALWSKVLRLLEAYALCDGETAVALQLAGLVCALLAPPPSPLGVATGLHALGQLEWVETLELVGRLSPQAIPALLAARAEPTTATADSGRASPGVSVESGAGRVGVAGGSTPAVTSSQATEATRACGMIGAANML